MNILCVLWSVFNCTSWVIIWSFWYHLLKWYLHCQLTFEPEHIESSITTHCGAPLIHHYCVFGKGGAHFSLRGSYITKLRTFITQSEAESRWEGKWDLAQSSSKQKSSAPPRGIRQRDPDDGSLRCKARRAHSPCKHSPALPVSSTAVSSRTPRSLLYDGRPPTHTTSVDSSAGPGIDNVALSDGLPMSLGHASCIFSRRLSRPRAPFDVSVFLPGKIGRETVCIAIARYRWEIPS